MSSTGVRIAFCWHRPTPPFFIGGAEVSQRILAERLCNEGYKVTYLGSYSHPRDDTISWRCEFEQYLADSKFEGLNSSGGDLRYTYRGIECRMVEQQELDVAFDGLLNQCEIAAVFTAQERSDKLASKAMKARVRTIAWLHSSTDVGLLALRAIPDIVLATSRFVQKQAKEKYRAGALVFYPPYEAVTGTSSGSAITMINPIPEKGVDVFLDLARKFPQREFLAIEGWYPVDLRAAPPNVQYMAKRIDLSDVWNKTRILLVPSRIEEGFCRVVGEAGLYGIPALGSALGGLPEAIRSGGIVLHGFGVTMWADALRRILQNGEMFDYLSDEARKNSHSLLRDPVAELRSLNVLP